MAQWFVELLGDGFDLEEFPRNFRSGDCLAVEKNGRTYLTGPCFQDCEGAAQAREKAGTWLELQFGTLVLLIPNLRKPRLGHVSLEHEDGRVDAFAFPEGVQARGKVSALVSATVNGQPVLPGITRAEELMKGSRNNPHLKRALQLWADPNRGWSQLYGVLEEVESAIGQHVNKAGWASRSQRSQFTQTANSAETGGLRARHGLGRNDPPPKPMAIEEGREFIRALLMRALRDDAND